MVEREIQLIGVGEGNVPVTLGSAQIHGDRRLLREHPETVQLYIRGTKKRGGGGGGGRAASWRLFRGRQMVDPLLSSPTVFQGTVYSTLQHALLACLLWFTGGSSQFTFYPNGVRSYPTLTTLHGATLGIEPDGALDIHWLPHEPAHSELLEVGECLRQRGVSRCLVIVGALQPLYTGMKERPQLRGILCHASTLRTDRGDDSFPTEAVEHGWYACLARDAAGGRLLFVRNAQDQRGPLAPAVLPSLYSIGVRLWRRGDAAHALVNKGTPLQSELWDDLIRRFLEETVISSSSPTQEDAHND